MLTLGGGKPTETVDRMQCLQQQSEKHEQRMHRHEKSAIMEKTLIKWVKAYPTTNEMTHFACIMDPMFWK